MVGEPVRFQRYAITDLAAAVGSPLLDAPTVRRLRWIADVRRWASKGVDFIQLREKQLGIDELARLSAAGMELLRELPGNAHRPQLLVNGRADAAAAVGADGVHLTSHPGELSPAQVRLIFHQAGRTRCLVSVSCHSLAAVVAASKQGVDMILFGPVFGKTVHGESVAPGLGLQTLHAACVVAGHTPVLALGAVEPGNVQRCLDAGAAGVAGIRLFAD